jgi:4-hydroxy-tetrahydrodipicolinate reductase
VRPYALTVFGITGRMGQSLIRALREDPQFRLRGAIASADSVRLGKDAAADGAPTDVLISADPEAGLRQAVVALDFSVGSAVAAHARACAAASIPLLVGATGYDAAAKDELARAAESIAVLIAPNTSVGVAVLHDLAAAASRALGGYDVDIAEAHHRDKRDAPSGTALNLAATIAKSRGVDPAGIDISVVRSGDIVGEHTVSFTGAGERLEITHRATDRITFARGALRAAAWLIGRPAGLYGMQDVLGIVKKHGQ